MSTVRPLFVAIALTGLVPNELFAQVRPQPSERLHDVSVDVGGLSLRRRDEQWRSAVSVVPHWRTATSDGAFYLGGAVSGTQNGYEAAYGTLGLELTPQTSRSRQWDLAGTATVLSARATQAIGVASLRGRKHWMSEDQGAWFGVTLGGRTQDQTQFGSLAAEASFWRTIAPATTLMLTASATQAGDFQYYEYSDAPEAEFRLPHTARFGELAAALRHVDRRVEVSMDARYRVGPVEVLGGSGAFSGDVALWLTSRYALVGLVGRQLADPALGTASTVYASIGLRIASRTAGTRAHLNTPREPLPTRRSEIGFARDNRAASAAAVSEMEFAGARGGVYVELRAPTTAATVEVAGDFTDWQPVALERHNGVWRLPTVLPFGVYRIIVRIDGAEWRPPVGFPRLHDEFGGQVGVITVR